MYNQPAQQRSQQNKNSDFELINIWLQQIPPIQQSSHLYIAQMFLKFIRKPLEKVTSADVIAFANVQSINSHNRESHQQKRLETINSLLKFGQQTGILPTTQKKTTTQKKILSRNTTNLKKSASSQDKIKNYRTARKVQKKTLNWSKLFNLQLASSLLIILGLFIAISQLFRQVGGVANADKKGSGTSVVMPKIDPTKNWAYPVNVSRIRAFLDTISVTEGTTGPQGYYRQYTGSHFSSFEDHPRELKCALSNGKELCSDAAGRYQFLSTSWDRFAPMVKAKNFAPTYQDRVAIELIREKNALEDIEEGRIEEAFRKLYMVWPSFGETAADVERLMPKLVGTYEQKLALYQPNRE
ncbi:MAG: glycoside hydrolase family 104 protein [Cyanobacteria bacterium P01_H01_bin.35]